MPVLSSASNRSPYKATGQSSRRSSQLGVLSGSRDLPKTLYNNLLVHRQSTEHGGRDKDFEPNLASSVRGREDLASIMTEEVRVPASEATDKHMISAATE